MKFIQKVNAVSSEAINYLEKVLKENGNTINITAIAEDKRKLPMLNETVVFLNVEGNRINIGLEHYVNDTFAPVYATIFELHSFDVILLADMVIAEMNAEEFRKKAIEHVAEQIAEYSEDACQFLALNLLCISYQKYKELGLKEVKKLLLEHRTKLIKGSPFSELAEQYAELI